ncbi:MAG: 4'-phosphopantetheinyl transferase superfamily protein [Sneathiella sp.]
MLSNLFPEYVSVSFGALHTNEELLKYYPLPVQLQKAKVSRQLEFLSGRFFAKKALTKLGHKDANDPIPIKENRAPVWPHNVVGSISHTDIFVGAAVANASDALGIGFDIEHIFSKKIKDQIQDLVSDVSEWNNIRSNRALDDCLKLTLIYVAKEAIYKCLSPITQIFFGFHDVEILEIDLNKSNFKAKIVKNLHPTLELDLELKGNFIIDRNTVYGGLIFPHD